MKERRSCCGVQKLSISWFIFLRIGGCCAFYTRVGKVSRWAFLLLTVLERLRHSYAVADLANSDSSAASALLDPLSEARPVYHRSRAAAGEASFEAVTYTAELNCWSGLEVLQIIGGGYFLYVFHLFFVVSIACEADPECFRSV